MVINNGKVLIRFTIKGRWAEYILVSSDQFEVFAGEEKYVSLELAKIVVESGKGEYVTQKLPDELKPRKKPGPKPKNETGPMTKAETRRWMPKRK